MSVIETNGYTNDGNQKLAYQHPKCTPDEENAASKPLHSVKRNRGGADINEREDEGD
jgi:hypothetical protein